MKNMGILSKLNCIFIEMHFIHTIETLNTHGSKEWI
jgi:hypothetical protein